MNDKIVNVKKGFTHGGVFHADDVFATALLRIINPEIEIVRGFQVPEDFVGIVYDIGMGEFDHHQENRRIRENGIPYAAFGLLWEQVGEQLVGKEESIKFDEKFVQPLDYGDNTGEGNELSFIVADFLPAWDDEKQDLEAAFWRAVFFAQEILERRFSKIRSSQKAFEIVTEYVEKTQGPIMVLEQSLPWKNAVKDTDIVYVIYESKRGGYNIQAVPDEDNGLVKPFPKEWRGKEREELRHITGIEGFRFCHMSGFLCTAERMEDAWSIAKLALEE